MTYELHPAAPTAQAARLENLPDRDYLFVNGEWWVRSAAVRSILGESA